MQTGVTLSASVFVGLSMAVWGRGEVSVSFHHRHLPYFFLNLGGFCFACFRLLNMRVHYGEELDCNFYLGDLLSITIIASYRRT